MIVATDAALVAACLATDAQRSGRDRSPAAQIAGAGQRLAESKETGRQKDETLHRAQAAIPTINVEKTCRDGGTLMGRPATESQIEQCVASERSAREQIAGQWGEYTARDKARCVQTNVYQPSYVEWLTCLEMERDVRDMN